MHTHCHSNVQKLDVIPCVTDGCSGTVNEHYIKQLKLDGNVEFYHCVIGTTPESGTDVACKAKKGKTSKPQDDSGAIPEPPSVLHSITLHVWCSLKEFTC